MFQLPDLPYGYDALSPTISETTMRTHHDKHHAKYVDNTNKMIADEGGPQGSMEDVVRAAARDNKQKLFNNAGQAWNHAFFWECMTPNFQPPSGALAEAINSTFGGLEGLQKAFQAEGEGHFASGWAWLVAEGEKLAVISTHDADTALLRDATPILVCDVWEHAYYLDYKNDRAAFLKAWWEKVVNWKFAAAQYEAACGRGQGYRYPSGAQSGATAV